ncbi:MAG: hypothetical protein CMO98_10510 [Woeseia sp.]|nr:hypothetical protein [Woeseia sp.]|tara:strand:- start:1735 stop:1998 length:264 start_codon:yes stop_codon:yes gene_type:complete
MAVVMLVDFAMAPSEIVAMALGMTRAAYRRYERDETTPTVDRAMQLCALLHRDMNTLCHGSESSTASEGGEVHISIKVPSAQTEKRF